MSDGNVDFIVSTVIQYPDLQNLLNVACIPLSNLKLLFQIFSSLCDSNVNFIVNHPLLRSTLFLKLHIKVPHKQYISQ